MQNLERASSSPRYEAPTMPPPFLTDTELRRIAEPLRQPAAIMRWFKRAGFEAKQKPNGMPLISRVHFEQVMRGQSTNMVRPNELLEAARDEDDGTYLVMHNEHLGKTLEADAAAWRTSSLSFNLLVLLAVDATLPANSSLSISFIHFLNSAFSNLGIFIGWLVVLVLFASWLFRFIEDDYDRGWVTCPKLYAKLERKRQKEEQERRSAVHRTTFD